MPLLPSQVGVLWSQRRFGPRFFVPDATPQDELSEYELQREVGRLLLPIIG